MVAMINLTTALYCFIMTGHFFNRSEWIKGFISFAIGIMNITVLTFIN